MWFCVSVIHIGFAKIGEHIDDNLVFGPTRTALSSELGKNCVALAAPLTVGNRSAR